MPVPESIEDAAAAWVVRLERGLTGPEQDDFLQWLTADPRHGEEFNRQKANWARLNLLADWRPEHGPRPNRDLLAPPPPAAPRPTAPTRRWRPPLRRAAFVPLAAAAALAIGLFLTTPWRSAPSTPSDDSAAGPAEPIARIERRTLDDGSIVELNRGAALSQAFSATERRLRLERGEAHFQVAKDPARPFIVEVGGLAVRAVGTAFNIRCDSAAIDVLVTEGKIEMQPAADPLPAASRPAPSPAVAAGALNPPPSAAALAGAPATATTSARHAPATAAAANPPAAERSFAGPTEITAGHRVVVSRLAPTPVPAVAPVTAAQIDHLLAWQPRLLDFSEAPLERVIEEFNRRNAPIRLQFSDPSLARIVVSATLRSDNVEGFVRLLETGFGVRARREGTTVILQPARRS